MKRNSILISAAAALLVFLAGMSVIGGQGRTSLLKPEGSQAESFGSSDPEASVSRAAFLLNTFVTVTLYGTDDGSILDDSLALCKEYENIFSRTLKTSELYQINHRDPEVTAMTVSDEMARLLKKGLEYCELSDGAFDITVEPLSSLWDFTGETHSVPEAAKIREAAKKVDYRNLSLSGNTLTFLSPDTSIDLGAIAKGYIADRMKEQLLEAGAKSAIINLGGNVLCVGSLPDGAPFRIGLQMPFADYEETFETLGISDLSVVTSGIYERSFTVDGTLYHHILNPKTGYPYDNGLIAVTILSGESVDGDGLSTTCFSLGLEEGLKLAESLEGVEACFIDSDYRVHYTSGMKSYLLSQDTRLPEARE